MQTDWLIDFMTLAETRSFSRAAQLRHVTQPAFSRRIRALEAWAATALVDRSRHPHTLTQAGQLLHARAPELVASMQHTHALLRDHTSIHPSVLRFAAPDGLAFNFFPDWIHGLETVLNGLAPHLTTLDPVVALERLSQGECDLMLAYVGTDCAEAFDPGCFEVVRLDGERLLPCVRPDGSGQPRHHLPGTLHAPVPYLACAERTTLGQVTERVLQRQPERFHLQRVFESDACENVMAMALAGRGLAFLPERSVQAELSRERLVVAGSPLPTTLDICLVRLRAIDGGGNPRKRPGDALWGHLQARGTGLKDDRPCALAIPRAHRNEVVEPA